MTNTTPVSKYLTEINVPHVEFVHPGKVESLAQAAKERNQPEEQVVRSILFRLSEGEYAMVLIGGPSQISWKALRQHFEQSRLTMATPDEVKQVTGYAIGSVSPFGMDKSIPVLIDQRLPKQPSVSIGSGVRGTAIMIDTKIMINTLDNPAIGAFSKG
ncbi:MAG: YbaK/EbsC family protein [Chloroflexota bacterium]